MKSPSVPKETPEKEIAESVDTVSSRKHNRVDHIALGLGHFLAADIQPAVTVYLFRKGTEGHEKSRPYYRMKRVISLPTKCTSAGQYLSKSLYLAVHITQGGDVVRQRVNPDIDHMLGVKADGIPI